jgi:hypothetical protein
MDPLSLRFPDLALGQGSSSERAEEKCRPEEGLHSRLGTPPGLQRDGLSGAGRYCALHLQICEIQLT